MKMKKFSVCLMMSMVLMGARADDFGIWSEVEMSQNLGVKGLSADLGLGFRTNNNVRNVNRWSGNVGLNYSLCKNLKIGAGYTYIYNYSLPERQEKYKSDNVSWSGYNYTHPFWRSKNRFNFDVKGDVDLGRFNVSLRERVQITRFLTANTGKDKYRYNSSIDAQGVKTYVLKDGYPEYEKVIKDAKTKDYLRSKLAVSYNIRRCPITPDVSVELENNLREGFHLDEVRYSAGADYKLVSKKVYLGVHYHFNKGEDDDQDSDIHSIELSLKLKNIFFAPKK